MVEPPQKSWVPWTPLGSKVLISQLEGGTQHQHTIIAHDSTSYVLVVELFEIPVRSLKFCDHYI